MLNSIDLETRLPTSTAGNARSLSRESPKNVTGFISSYISFDINSLLRFISQRSGGSPIIGFVCGAPRRRVSPAEEGSAQRVVD